MTRLAVLSVALVLVAADATAQTSRPGVDCALLTATQARGLPCATPPQADPEPALPTGDPLIDEACQPTPNPYTDPDRSLLCFLMHRRRDVQSTPFLLGGVYQERHPARTLVVTDLRLEPDARTTVIGRWLRHEDPAQRGRLYAILPSDAFTRIDP